MLRRPLIAVALVLLLAGSTASAELTGKVVAVADGDTLTLLDGDNVQHKIRLHGIDAPERGQAFGNKSREALAALTMGKQLAVNVSGLDRYKREIGVVSVAGENVNLRMVRDGWAWHFVKYAPNDKVLAAAQTDAREARRGLWADGVPLSPWDHRAIQAAKRKKR